MHIVRVGFHNQKRKKFVIGMTCRIQINLLSGMFLGIYLEIAGHFYPTKLMMFVGYFGSIAKL